MYKRVFTTALTLLLGTCLLAGCGGGNTPSGTTPGGTTPGGTTPGGTTPGEIGPIDYLTHGETHTSDKDYPAGDHVWDTNNTCTVCGYKLPVTDGLLYTEVEGGVKVGYDWGNEALTAAETVVIPAYHDGKKVVAVPGLYPDGETSGDPDATTFATAGFKVVAVPNTVEKISTYAFYNCAALEEAYNGGGTLGEGIFINCTALEKAALPEDAQSIPKNTFANCKKLCDFQFPSSVTEIGDQAFLQCYVLRDFELPASVEKIGTSAFRNCSSLTHITLPASLTELGDNAFYDCRRLADVCNLSALAKDELLHKTWKDTELGRAFSDLYVDNLCTDKAQAGTFTEKDDFLFYTLDGKTSLIFYSGDETEITLPATDPNGEKYTVHAYAFYRTNLVSVATGDGVTELGNCAFENCADLTSITFGNFLEKIGEGCFYASMKKLTSVSFPASLTYIGKNAFNSALTSATFAETEGWTREGDYETPVTDLSNPAQNAQWLAKADYWKRTTT